MKNILLILVGGTICTAVNDEGTLSVSDAAGSMLKDYFYKSDSEFAHKEKVKIHCTENLHVLSENMTVGKWNEILDTYRSYVGKNEYDGIIFAHGTDTLAYSAALFSLILSNTPVPVFFVSSNKRLDLIAANGNANFRCAVECICRGIRPNVYVPYKNISDGRMYLHMASRLRQCANYSEDFFSKDAVEISDSSEQSYKIAFGELEKLYPQKMPAEAVNVFGDWRLSDCVLMITPYVGINYEAYNYDAFRAVLHGTFHSGTACAEQTRDSEYYGRSSILKMVDLCADNSADLYVSPAKSEGEVYETVRIIENHEAKGKKVRYLYGCTNEMAYAKILLAYSVFDSREQITSFLAAEVNYEFID